MLWTIFFLSLFAPIAFFAIYLPVLQLLWIGGIQLAPSLETIYTIPNCWYLQGYRFPGNAVVRGSGYAVYSVVFCCRLLQVVREEVPPASSPCSVIHA